MYNIYVVSPGDSIESIALRYNSTPQELYEINSFLKPNEPLSIGQRIIVPVPKTNIFEYYTVKKGDSLFEIAQKYNIKPEELSNLNGLEKDSYLYEGQVLVVPKPGVSIVITKEGDTIAQIGKNLDSNLEQILLQNPEIYLLPDQLIVYKKTST